MREHSIGSPPRGFEINEATLPVVEEIGKHMPGGFFIYKAKAPEELLYANKACFDIFGCEDLEDFKKLTGYTFKGMLYPEDYEAISKSITEQIGASKDGMDYVEYRIVRRDGQIRWVDDYGHYTETEKYGGVYYVFLSDITEKRAERERHREENRRLTGQVASMTQLANLLDSVTSMLSNLPAMSFSKDAKTRVYLACNQAFAEYAGKTKPEEVVGLTDHEIFDKETADHFVEDDTKALAMNGPYTFFEDVPDATGTDFRNLQTTKIKYYEPSGRLCLLGLCVDVTEVTRLKTEQAMALARQRDLEERLQNAQALKEALEAAEQANKAKTAFLSNMSHEIRTPINAVLGMNEMILRESTEKNVLEYAENIRTAGSRLLSLVNELLSFSKDDGAAAPLPEQKGSRKTFTAPDAAILVVDDTPMNLTVFKGLLKNTQMQIDTADSGGGGLALMRKKKYDLIVLDHMMPEMDGIETLHELRRAGGASAGGGAGTRPLADGRADADNPNAKTPVVCLTANAIPGAREMYLAEGFDDYLTKPIEGAELEAAIIKYLPPEKVTIQEAAEEAEEDAPEEMTELRAFYAGVPELNYGDALRFCSNEELLEGTLEQFYRAIKPNISAIDGFLAEKDYKNYTIRVHALKSSARLIGAEKLSADARHLEDLGNSLTAEDIGRIEELTPKLLADYRRFLDLLSPLYAEAEAARESAPEISLTDLNEAYDAIRQFVESFDIDAIDGFISEIRKYRIPDAEAAKFATVEECVRNMDWIGLEEALKG